MRALQVASARTLSGHAVTALSTCQGGSVLLASDFLASVTVMQLEAGGGGASSHEGGASSGSGVALQALSADRSGVFAQAALLLDSQRALVGVHPQVGTCAACVACADITGIIVLVLALLAALRLPIPVASVSLLMRLLERHSSPWSLS